MASMRNWLHDDEEQEKHTADKAKRRVAVVHCKAGKGRSGTVACSYLISQEGWTKADALKRFTERRMRAGFGEGVSIPSQLRYVGYVDRWTNQMSKQYVERPVEILELHVWGLRDGVKASVEGFVDGGKGIKCFHAFDRDEKVVVEDGTAAENPRQTSDMLSKGNGVTQSQSSTSLKSQSQSAFSFGSSRSSEMSTVIFKPSSPLILPTSDVNIDFERRNTGNYTGWTMVTSLAHVWFNVYFEGGHQGADSGVFEIDWEAMDGIKGSAKKGIRALDKMKVVWRYSKEGEALSKVITEPARGEAVLEPEAANWKGEENRDETAEAQAKRSDGVSSGRAGASALTMGATIAAGSESLRKELGLRKQTADSTNISRANSPTREDHKAVQESHELEEGEEESEDGEHGVRALGPEGEEHITYGVGHDGPAEELEGRQDTKVGHNFEMGMGKLGNVIAKMKGDNKHDSGKT